MVAQSQTTTAPPTGIARKKRLGWAFLIVLIVVLGPVSGPSGNKNLHMLVFESSLAQQQQRACAQQHQKNKSLSNYPENYSNLNVSIVHNKQQSNNTANASFSSTTLNMTNVLLNVSSSYSLAESTNKNTYTIPASLPATDSLNTADIQLQCLFDYLLDTNVVSKRITKRKKKMVLLELGEYTKRHGFGAIVMMALRFQAHYSLLDNNTVFVLDQSRLEHYRRNASLGLFSGFFASQTTPSWIVLDQRPSSWDPITKTFSVTKISHVKHNTWLKSFRQYDQSRIFLRRFDGNNVSAVYARLAQRACTFLQWTDETRHEIRLMLQKASIPDFLRLQQHDGQQQKNNFSGTHHQSAAFHIRRRDKVWSKEARAYGVQEYVQALQQGLLSSSRHEQKQKHDQPQQQEELNIIRRIQHCYVATDDVSVVSPLQSLLQKSPWNCTLHSLAKHLNHHGVARSGHHNAIGLMADVQQLTQATYFVGSWSSNLGRFVTLWRSCVLPSISYSSQHHFYHSYAVEDDDEWLMK